MRREGAAAPAERAYPSNGIVRGIRKLRQIKKPERILIAKAYQLLRQIALRRIFPQGAPR